MEVNELIGWSIIVLMVVLGQLIKKKRDIRMPIIEDRVKLLPYWLKPIGLGLAITSLVAIIIKHSLNLDIDVHYLMLATTISLLIMAISSEKHEDELYRQLRQNAIYYSFFGTVIGFLFLTGLNLLSSKELIENPEFRVLLLQLFFYLTTFNSMKKRMKKLNSVEV